MLGYIFRSRDHRGSDKYVYGMALRVRILPPSTSETLEDLSCVHHELWSCCSRRMEVARLEAQEAETLALASEEDSQNMMCGHLVIRDDFSKRDSMSRIHLACHQTREIFLGFLLFSIHAPKHKLKTTRPSTRICMRPQTQRQANQASSSNSIGWLIRGEIFNRNESIRIIEINHLHLFNDQVRMIYIRNHQWEPLTNSREPNARWLTINTKER